MPTTQAFGDLLREARLAAALTQEELAERAGLSPRSISDLERGVNRTARKETARLLAEGLRLAEPARSEFVALARGRAGVPERPTFLPGTAAGGSARPCHLEVWMPAGVEVVPLGSARVSIGRGDTNDVALVHDRTASRLHAVLDRVGDGWCLQDAGSRNGTFVGDERVVGPRALRHGDAMTIGASKLVFREEDPAATTRTEQAGSARLGEFPGTPT